MRPAGWSHKPLHQSAAVLSSAPLQGGVGTLQVQTRKHCNVCTARSRTMRTIGALQRRAAADGEIALLVLLPRHASLAPFPHNLRGELASLPTLRTQLTHV